MLGDPAEGHSLGGLEPGLKATSPSRQAGCVERDATDGLTAATHRPYRPGRRRHLQSEDDGEGIVRVLADDNAGILDSEHDHQGYLVPNLCWGASDSQPRESAGWCEAHQGQQVQKDARHGKEVSDLAAR